MSASTPVTQENRIHRAHKTLRVIPVVAEVRTKRPCNPARVDPGALLDSRAGYIAGFVSPPWINTDCSNHTLFRFHTGWVE